MKWKAFKQGKEELALVFPYEDSLLGQIGQWNKSHWSPLMSLSPVMAATF